MSPPLQYCSQIVQGHRASLRVSAFPDNSTCLELREESGCISVTSSVHQFVAIKRTRRFPLPTYSLAGQSETIWQLATKSLFRNQHTLQIEGGDSWSFRTPLFSLGIQGVASSGAKMFGSIGRRKTEWYWSVEPQASGRELLSALAFLHWRWYFAS